MMGYGNGMMGYGNGMMDNGNWNATLGGMGLWGIIALIFLVAVAAAVTLLVVWIVRRSPASRATGGGDGGSDILRRRFASGEIDDEESGLRCSKGPEWPDGQHPEPQEKTLDAASQLHYYQT